jgi:hypothetical protein
LPGRKRRQDLVQLRVLRTIESCGPNWTEVCRKVKMGQMLLGSRVHWHRGLISRKAHEHGTCKIIYCRAGDGFLRVTSAKVQSAVVGPGKTFDSIAKRRLWNTGHTRLFYG